MASLIDAVVKHAPNSALSVKESAGKGRYTVAAKDIPAGTVVWEERGFAFLPRSTSRSFICDTCMKIHPTPLTIKCTDCNSCYFCNEECQTNGASGTHRVACKGYQIVESLNERFSIAGDLLQMLALLLARSVETNTDAVPQPNGFRANFEHVLQLVSHTDKLSAKFRKDVRNATNHMYDAMEIPEHPDKDLGAKLVGIIKSNIHGDVDQLTFGLYPGLAMFCHSCRPTCVYQIVEGKALVRTCVDIKAGEELSISYLPDLLASRNRRAYILQSTRYFTCECDRCEQDKDNDILEGYICPLPDCRGVVHCEMTSDPVKPEDVTVCTKCKKDTPASIYEELIDKKLGPLLPLVPTFKGKKGGSKVCKRIAGYIQKPGGIHEMNELMIVSYKMMSHVCESDEDWPQAAEYVRIQLRVLEHLFPGICSLNKGECHRRLAYLYGKQAESLEGSDDPIKTRIRERLQEQQKKHQDEVQGHMKVCLGDGFKATVMTPEAKQ